MMSDNRDYWIKIMRDRNRLQSLFLSNQHTYEEKFTLDANGLMITSIVGGKDLGIIVHNMISDIPYSIDNHFKDLKGYYETHKQDIAKNYKPKKS